MIKLRLHQIQEKIGCNNDTSMKNTSGLFNEIDDRYKIQDTRYMIMMMMMMMMVMIVN